MFGWFYFAKGFVLGVIGFVVGWSIRRYLQRFEAERKEAYEQFLREREKRREEFEKKREEFWRR